MKNRGFTLSEVLITLVVIGIIAAITIPSVIQSVQNNEYKSAYKKAYSDLSNAVLRSVAFKEFPVRETKFDKATTKLEWEEIKKGFNIAKVCENNNAFDCWVNADTAYNKNTPYSGTKIFVDTSGRAWGLYNASENIYLVDTNGDKSPNRFGKDRWIFALADQNSKRICGEGDSENLPPCANIGYPQKIIPFRSTDYYTKSTSWCNYPPCLYYSWLYE